MNVSHSIFLQGKRNCRKYGFLAIAISRLFQKKFTISPFFFQISIIKIDPNTAFSTSSTSNIIPKDMPNGIFFIDYHMNGIGIFRFFEI